jgi:enoyl-CoA hydratase/carnithine racemase
MQPKENTVRTVPADPRDEAVRYDLRDGVAIMTLNRPDRRNAWNLELGRGMEADLH